MYIQIALKKCMASVIVIIQLEGSLCSWMLERVDTNINALKMSAGEPGAGLGIWRKVNKWFGPLVRRP